MPQRAYTRRKGPGAHQLASPARRMKAGTSVALMRVASMSTAIAKPTPKSLMNVIFEVAKAMNTTAMRAARAVTMLPVRSRPMATECTLSPVRSCSSFIRDRRKTS